MDLVLVVIPAAFWLGLLTSISPCPLATNIAAVSYIGKDVGSTSRACLAGILYTIGRSLTYIVLGAVLVSSLLSVPQVSDFLQRQLNLLLGPILILVGMVLLDLIQFKAGAGSRFWERLQKRASSLGLIGGLLLGVLFAASFCPLSAALFFGSLIPLAVKAESALLIPAVYGIGSALPALAFSLLLSFGLTRLGSAYGKATAFERYARIITGIIFVLVGIYYTVIYIFKVPL